jgi:hypothetical protein
MAICRLRLTIAHGKYWTALHFCNSIKELKRDKIDSAGVDWMGYRAILFKPSQNEKAIGI